VDIRVSEQVNNEEVVQEETTTEETVAVELTQEELLTQQIQELETRTLRIQADYDNYRRRTLQEKEEFAKYASKNVIEKLLPVLDNLERALQASELNPDIEALKKGLDMVLKQFESTLEAEGLTAIAAVGEAFNPDHHQAIMTVDSDEHEEGIVVEEVMKGYKLKDKVLRPSMVKVSN
jgi:molecular chaperone GrpE